MESKVTPQSHKALNDIFRTHKHQAPFYASCTGNPLYFANANDPKAQAETDWGLGGLLLMEDIEGGRKKGTLSWSGLPNLYWVCSPPQFDIPSLTSTYHTPLQYHLSSTSIFARPDQTQYITYGLTRWNKQWIDPTTGICGMYATQMHPVGDAECARMNNDFEMAVYEELELVRRFLRS